jgi:hypothetical protein
MQGLLAGGAVPHELAEEDADAQEACTLRPLQAAAVTTASPSGPAPGRRN